MEPDNSATVTNPAELDKSLFAGIIYAKRVYNSTTVTKLIHRKKSSGIVEKTIVGIVSLLKETVATEAIAGKRGLLQKADPRFKFLSIAILLICSLMTKSAVLLAGFYAIIVILALLSSVNLGFFLLRTFLFIPVFSLFIVLPALFSFVTPGQEVYSWNVFGWHTAITRQGIDSEVIFFLRVLSSVSMSILLVLTTRHHVLLKTLRMFKVPKLFVMTIGMTYRYIFLLLDLIQKTWTAIKSRVGFVTSVKSGQRIATVNIAGLWLHSYRLQSQVYDAMLSRGYTGEPHIIEEFRVRPADYLFVAVSLILLIGTLWLNRYFH
jgi:cobalt ECF transporter T component CbiQ